MSEQKRIDTQKIKERIDAFRADQRKMYLTKLGIMSALPLLMAVILLTVLIGATYRPAPYARRSW